MQLLDVNWTVFSLTLVLLFLFGVLYAWIVNVMSRSGVTGQTAFMVAVGVGVALIASIPTFGLVPVAILFAYFTACGTPMLIEYAARVHQERQADLEAAKHIALTEINNERIAPESSDNEQNNDGLGTDR